MSSLKQLLLEDKGKHTYGCAMLFFDFPELQELQNKIDPEDIYTDPDSDRTFGLEEDPHVTLLYGLHDGVRMTQVRRVLDEQEFGTCKVFNPSLFINPKYDVFKFDITGKGLYEANKALREYPYTTEHDEYHPHVTIGYLKPGTGKKYTEKFADESYNLIPDHAVYSVPSGTEHQIPINVVD